MSGSSAFANYSNTTQQLSNSISQLAPTTKQITDDKANFEQQFLIGAALAAKMKATDKLAGLFKKSKTISSLKGKAEGEIRNFAKSAQSRAESVANDLVSKVKGVSKPVAPPTLNPSASPDNLDVLKDLADKASSKLEGTAKALEDANNKIIDTRDAVKTAYQTRDAAEAVVESNSARAVQQAGGRIVARSQIDDAVARKTLNDARSGVDNSEAEALAAEQERNTISEQLVQHQSDAEQATQDVQRAGQAGKDIESTSQAAAETETAVADGAKALKVAKDLEDGEKALKVTSDVEKGAVETSEADPLGLIVAGVAAIATQIIGRNLKAHKNVVSAPVPATTFSATLGA